MSIFSRMRARKNADKLEAIKNQQEVISAVKEGKSIEQQIHESVFSAQEALLAEALKIVATPPPYDQEKHDRMEQMVKLGFAKAEEVKEFREQKASREHWGLLKLAIEDYKQRYPLNRFISEASVRGVCIKYNLLLTEVTDYIAEIPEKNQKEIVNFKVKRKDVRAPRELDNRFNSMYSHVFNDYYYPKAEYRIENGRAVQIEIEKEAMEKHLQEMTPGKFLCVMAPEHKLDTRSKIKEGHLLKNNDPIILQPVNYGFLIVSAWGLEAGDELVVNSISN